MSNVEAIFTQVGEELCFLENAHYVIVAMEYIEIEGCVQGP